MSYSVSQGWLKLLAGTFFILFVHVSMAQTPYISSIDKTSAAVSESVVITGIGFPTDTNDLSVKFGGVEASVLSTSENLIEVSVPAGASFDNITVTNIDLGLTAYSSEVFSIGYGGTTFDPSRLDSGTDQFDIATGEKNTFDLCLCDFNNDGLNDVVTTNNNADAEFIQVFENESTVTTLSLTRSNRDLNIPTINTTCGDLDGDGRSDLLVSRGGGSANSFLVFRNISMDGGAINFDDFETITLPNDGSGNIRNPRRLFIKDLDLDGKPEVSVTNESDNVIDVYKNTSTTGTIIFANGNVPFQFEVEGASKTSGIDIKDLNNDGLPEVLVINDQDSDLFILQNSSEPGTLSFLEAINLTTNGVFRNVKSGDLNNDGLNDIAMTNNTGSTVSIFENMTSGVGAEIEFETVQTISGVSGSWGLDMGDINGDGLLDIAIASISSSSRAVYLLINTTTSSISFDVNSISTENNSRNVRIADMNGDGKPDMVFTHNTGLGADGDLSIIANRQCVVPIISPSTQVTICSGLSTRLTTTSTEGATYVWSRADLGSSAFATVETSTNNFLNVSAEGTYRVTVLSDENSCSFNSGTVNVVIDNSAFITNPMASDNDGGAVICPGGTNRIELSATSAGVGATYSWTGPENFTSALQNPELTGLTPEKSGQYSVVAEKDGCMSEPSTTSVVIESLPTIAVNNSGQDTFCAGSSVEVSVTNFGSDYSYQWKRNGADVNDATVTTLSVNASGDYSAVITANGSGCFSESPPRTIQTIVVPTASFTTSVSAICVDLTVDFDASNSMGEAGFDLTYNWAFGDGTNATGLTTSHAYTSAGSIQPALTIAYADVTSCTTDAVQGAVVVQDPPSVDITTDTGSTEKCPSDELTLNLTGNFTNIVWSTGATDNSITVADPGTFTFSAVDAVGCVFTSNPLAVSNLANSGIDISSSSHTIVDGIISLEPDDPSVSLTVNNATGPVWQPSDVIDNNQVSSITVFPQDIRTEVTVTGTDPNGCTESDMVVIENDNVRAKKVFSPNGDGIGDECWEITNASSAEFAQCTVFVFDSKGKVLFSSVGPFIEDCVWDGTFNGRELPEGIYYYALKCANASISQSGTILLGR